MTIEITGLPNPDHAAILAAALDAVDPYQAVAAALHVEGTNLTIAGTTIDLAPYRRALVLGAGKAAAPMAEAVEWTLKDAFKTRLYADRVEGLVVTKYDHGLDGDQFTLLGKVEVVEAAHPVPDAAGLQAGARILALAEGATADDLVIVVLSGGGSALLEALPDGISLDDLQAMTALLLASGATITELNTVRKHLSRIKGGQLARALTPACVSTLVLSDVVGSPLDAIASGPTVPDTTTWEDVAQILDRFSLWDRLPGAVAERLRAGMSGALPDTPKPGDPCFADTLVEIVGDNRVAALAAQAKAIELGYDAEIITNALEGEAAEVARQIVADAVALQNHPLEHQNTKLLLYGGETTVTLGNSPGKGGRNQEMALASALALERTRGITFVALATDGTDGPTDAAGGWADGESAQRARALGLNPEEALATHSAYDYLNSAVNLLVTGPTRTNVNDLIFVFVTAPDHTISSAS